ncbi:DUF6880 family protein [Methylobacterium goesingense]|uniref:Uncharacterized protein n=1 Tax=Methylobacterium goesingense TaxID=243690 RepID=A0ABV2KZ47_9HYPH|nr:DUF6880 family protein [Methylobacterium goesingense]GJD72015.1 hypothetical protein CFIICLFH_0224 [Methylobacterium goesingense]
MGRKAAVTSEITAEERDDADVDGPSTDEPAVADAAAKPAKPKRASRKTTPSHETLTKLGIERLITLVLTEASHNPNFKKVVTAAVAALQGPDAVAALIDRRLTALERASGYIDWMKQRAFALDLDAMLTTVVGELAALAPDAALDRLIRFLGGAGDVLGRAEDSSGRIHGVYERAADAAAALIVDLDDAKATAMAVRLVTRLETDGYGLIEGLMHGLIPRLPEAALVPLDDALAQATPPAPASGTKERDWLTEAERSRLMRLRQSIADRTGDVDAFIALETGRAPEPPDHVQIAERLLAAGRAREALKWVRRPQKRGTTIVTREQLLTGRFDTSVPERVKIALEVRIHDALGDTEAAQDLRWRTFENSLDREMLRAYLAKLPDFEDDEALPRAFAVAEAHPDPYGALAFFTHWPDPVRAARIVARYRGTWDGWRYEVLAPAAEALEDREPLAATELYRILIDNILEHAYSGAYGHAARYLVTLDDLADAIAPGAISPDPNHYRDDLRRRHGRKAAFWSQVRA